MEQCSFADRHFNPVDYILGGQTKDFKYGSKDVGMPKWLPGLGDGTGITKPENGVR